MSLLDSTSVRSSILFVPSPKPGYYDSLNYYLTLSLQHQSYKDSPPEKVGIRWTMRRGLHEVQDKKPWEFVSENLVDYRGDNHYHLCLDPTDSQLIEGTRYTISSFNLGNFGHQLFDSNFLHYLEFVVFTEKHGIRTWDNNHGHNYFFPITDRPITTLEQKYSD